MSYVIACDLGTGGIKASLYDEQAQCVASCFQDYATRYPQPGFHEQNPEDWWAAFTLVCRQLLAKSQVDNNQILALGISGHSLGLVPLNKSNQPLLQWTPIWSDTRAQQQADEFFRHYDADLWYQQSGNGFPAAHYPLFKLKWLQQHQPHVFTATHSFVGSKDYINLCLTGVVAADHSYASGCGAYHLQQGRYHEQVLAAALLPIDIFPPIFKSTDVIGTVSEQAAAETGLSTKVKVVAGGVDNSCMALGAGNVEAGSAYQSLGSSSWIAVSAEQPLLDLRTKPFVFAHVVPGLFTSATAIFSAGTALDWCRQQLLGGIEYEQMTQMAKESPPGANGLLFNPTLAGGSSLDKSAHCRGGLAGLSLAHTRCDIARASFEGICLSMKTAYRALYDILPFDPQIRIVGGGCQNDFWMQMFADVYGCPVVTTPVQQQCGALGAAALAGVGVGIWQDFSFIHSLHQQGQCFEPEPANVQLYQRVHSSDGFLAGALSQLGDMSQL